MFVSNEVQEDSGMSHVLVKARECLYTSVNTLLVTQLLEALAFVAG